MCEPVSIALGVASAAGGMMQAQAQHQAATAAAQRANIIQEQEYQNQLAISARRDEMKGQAFKAQLEAQAEAQNALARQQALNQLEATRASIASQQNLNEKATELAFKGQENLAKKIQAQGTIMASGQQSGQSLLLTMLNEDRLLGFKEAELNASLRDANIAHGINQWGIDLDKASADNKALNRLPSKPVAPGASLAPIKKPKVQGPSGLGLLGGMVSSVASGAQAGVGAYSTYKANGNSWS